MHPESDNPDSNETAIEIKQPATSPSMKERVTRRFQAFRRAFNFGRSRARQNSTEETVNRPPLEEDFSDAENKYKFRQPENPELVKEFGKKAFDQLQSFNTTISQRLGLSTTLYDQALAFFKGYTGRSFRDDVLKGWQFDPNLPDRNIWPERDTLNFKFPLDNSTSPRLITYGVSKWSGSPQENSPDSYQVSVDHQGQNGKRINYTTFYDPEFDYWTCLARVYDFSDTGHNSFEIRMFTKEIRSLPTEEIFQAVSGKDVPGWNIIPLEVGIDQSIVRYTNLQEDGTVTLSSISFGKELIQDLVGDNNLDNLATLLRVRGYIEGDQVVWDLRDVVREKLPVNSQGLGEIVYIDGDYLIITAKDKPQVRLPLTTNLNRYTPQGLNLDIPTNALAGNST